MTAAENKKLIWEAFSAWSHGDGRVFFKLVADDVQWTVTGSTAISGTCHSKQEFRSVLKSMSESLATPLEVKVRAIIADDDRVAVQWDSHAIGKNGTVYDQTYCWVMRLREGRVIECVAYLDTELVSRLIAGRRTQVDS